MDYLSIIESVCKIPSPVEKLHHAIFDDRSLQVVLKRDDLIHAGISGNKFRKLKYNLVAFSQSGKNKIASMGGAYSNHLHALAILGKITGINTIGFVRGKHSDLQNPTLGECSGAGMKIIRLSRNQYNQLRDNQKTFFEDDVFWIPEGGSNRAGVLGISEIIGEIQPFSPASGHRYVCTSVGTGTTLAGLVRALQGECMVLGFSALKSGPSVDSVKNLIGSDPHGTRWKMINDYSFGGIGKVSAELTEFADFFRTSFGIPLDLVYTAKMMFGLFQLIAKGFFPRGSEIFVIHTGGLQGNRGFQL